MDIVAVVQRLCLVERRRLLMIVGMAITVMVLFQCFALPFGRNGSLSPVNEGSVVLLISNAAAISNGSKSSEIHVSNSMAKDMNSADLGEEVDGDNEMEDTNAGYADDELRVKMGLSRSTLRYITSTDESSTQWKAMEIGQGHVKQVKEAEKMEATSSLTSGGLQKKDSTVAAVFLDNSTKNGENKDTSSRTSAFLTNIASADHMGTQTKNTELLQSISVTYNHNSTGASFSTFKRRWEQSMSISQMNSLLLQSLASSQSMTLQRSSVRDRELVSAKLGIQNAPHVQNTPGLYAPAFRNISMFKRSYELMERMLKVYIYKEGEKPIFHQSKMRGIYASEGWFMKLIEGNKKFIVRDPRKAHLFYLPFSSLMLRMKLDRESHSQKDLEGYLKNYVHLVAKKYSFWNRTGGADHFLVGCHDWVGFMRALKPTLIHGYIANQMSEASQITRQHMRNCIRVLCNANVAKGFRIGKDTTLPVTYIRSAETPIKDLGGKPPAERPILAFFAGGMHGYLRPILLKYWESMEPDMKIFGPMPRDSEGKRIYREYMKSSKYCICARGYEVHTPRVVEAIFSDCVPVIISDNYVPPFFEVLNWEAFSLFVQEKDIPNLRNILLSVPEEKYLAMQLGVKMVQQHFLWHKKPVKYDLFHMILHSVWYNRVSLMKSK